VSGRSAALHVLALMGIAVGSLSAQRVPAPAAVAPAITNIRYELVFDSATARRRSLGVGMRFDVTGSAPVSLSVPAWTPGAYEISNYARKVSAFSATANGRPLTWDKSDYDTWRIRPSAAGTVEIHFDFLADTLDNAMAWSKPDFLLVNGTNVFPYPEGIGLEFPSRVTVTTASGWRVLTGLDRDSAGGGYRAGNYHDLVDMPFFIGRFDVDSARIDSAWHRLASYPAGRFKGPAREALWRQLKAIVPEEARVFGETPWKNYSTMLIFDSSYGGGSALEHQSSHVGIYNPEFMGTALLASITAHEIFHAWNVKRLRPAEMVPYRYDEPEETTLLWVSEGITDYYSDLALVRSGVVDSTVFLAITEEKRQRVTDLPPVALEDASLSTWIKPTDGTADIYYDKGSLAGFLLDIMIRDATDNRQSLDGVFRTLYRSAYKQGKGFSVADWWAAVSAAAGGRSFTEFSGRYIDGREPFPWGPVAALGGFRYRADTTQSIRIGVSTISDSSRIVVAGVTAGSAAAQGGIEPGDQLLKLGEIVVKDQDFAEQFRSRYAQAIGSTIPVSILRAGTERTLQLEIRRETVVEVRLEYDRQAGPKAARIRHGILKGTTDK